MVLAGPLGLTIRNNQTKRRETILLTDTDVKKLYTLLYQPNYFVLIEIRSIEPLF